ncbi:MAG TPA: HDOD domain-containing protein [Methylomirabilota bacterium]|nr:HDOD domain-containing protein [Methylomirabilota bacterium]
MNEVKAQLPRLDRSEILAKVQNCPRLPSLRSIDTALRDLLNADQRYTLQISEVIRRDPSLTARLLRLVNSVYYSLTTPVNSIEEAVFYLGVRQIRQLAMVTPVIEDFQKLASRTPFPWRSFWQHCIATAILTREITNSVVQVNDDCDYIAGLVHDVGKIVMASAFPEHFREIYSSTPPHQDLLELERTLLGMDHAELGGAYLESHNLPRVMIYSARYHHEPAAATEQSSIVAAVHIADLLARKAKIGNSGNPAEVDEQDWKSSPAWDLIFKNHSEVEMAITRGNFQRTVEMLPSILDGIV